MLFLNFLSNFWQTASGSSPKQDILTRWQTHVCTCHTQAYPYTPTYTHARLSTPAHTLAYLHTPMHSRTCPRIPRHTHSHLCIPMQFSAWQCTPVRQCICAPQCILITTLKRTHRNLLNLRKHQNFDFHKKSYERKKEEQRRTKKDLDSPQTFEANNK